MTRNRILLLLFLFITAPVLIASDVDVGLDEGKSFSDQL